MRRAMMQGGVGFLAAIVASIAVTATASPMANGSDVDVGYAIYKGYYDTEYDLNIWKSIRYARPPVGKLRWQAPEPPLQMNRSDITPAVDQPPVCPQTGAYGTPVVYGFNSGPGNEDCLYLNVYAAPNSSNLPVLLWIHGGGYSDFGAVYDPSVLMNTNDNAFITVEIQYRLGAFGFLASPDIKSRGQLNAGLLDMQFALEWVQEHISKFGGDPARVTVGGESSGAGSALYLSIANGGTEKKVFNNIIAASPYLPAIYNYDDPELTENYDAFAELSGCGKDSSALAHHQNTFDCLVAADTVVLQNASGNVSTTRGYFGSFGFLPVIDGQFIRGRPLEGFQSGHVGGKRLLVGTNANEGSPLADPEIRNRTDFDDWISTAFPRLNEEDVTQLNSVYQISDAQPGDGEARFDTLGDTGSTALTQSGYATGIQQAAFDIFAESTFDCPAYWFAEAFSDTSRQSWKYQYSVEPNHHGADLSAYWAVGAEVPNEDFRHAFQKIWGNFIVHDDPAISVQDATAGYANATVPASPGSSMIEWPEYSILNPQQMNMNTTGGNVQLVTVTDDLSYNVRTGDGIVNTFSLDDARTWEGGRGMRCDFWRAVSSHVPY